MDFVADVGALDARFVREWGQQIDGLAQHSDVVAEVRVEGVSHSNDQDGTDRMGMTLAVSRVFHGACAAEDRLTVSTRRGGSGYRTLGANTTRLQTGRFVAFVRYYQGELGRTRAHWHLSAWSQPLAERLTPADPNERVVYSSSSVRSR